MTDHRMDWDRGARTGTSEAVLCDGKSVDQIAAILDTAEAAGKRLLLTRLCADMAATLARKTWDYDPVSQTAILGGMAAQPMRTGIGIVAAGTSDLPIAAEAQRTLAFHGAEASITSDVGVAGLWRLMDEIESLRQHRILIAIAGMEGALFSVLAGLTRAPIIAVPSPVGYGVARGGRLALDAALGSCAPGLVTVNIGNGFGAACAALRMLGDR
uniref:nickel pincer cofactor biosynthesis protein LarB n=1 Tax=Pararhizobium sp. IMCC3301 TaxID=3067904 RepID=UPI002741474D|nr:nickel pincer cofactor biosynthesis protein LarB [Pararhizobium sp. IMCC3301]